MKSLWSCLKLLLICLVELGFKFESSLPQGQVFGKSLCYHSFDCSANWRVKDSKLNCFSSLSKMHSLSYHILDCIQQKKTKFTMEQPYMLPILYCQYHACQCPGDLRSHGINRHSIDQISRNIPSPASKELTLLRHGWHLSWQISKISNITNLNSDMIMISCLTLSNFRPTSQMLKECSSGRVQANPKISEFRGMHQYKQSMAICLSGLPQHKTVVALMLVNRRYPIWWETSGSILAPIIACCLTAPNHLPEPMLTSHKWGSMAFTWE